MVRQASERQRLRAKALETVHLVAFAYDLACELAPFEDTTHCHTIANAMKALFGLYSCFGTTPFPPFPKEDAAKYTRNFLLLYIQLAKSVEGTDSCLWVLKPNFHLIAELLEYLVFEEGDPSLFWTYMDEDFVGDAWKIAHSKGGQRSAATTPANVLRKYRSLA